MNKTIKSILIFSIVFLQLLYFTPSRSSAASYSGQQVTCYLSVSGQYPARPGYTYSVGTTAASQYKTYNKFSDGPRIPFGTMVTLSNTVYLPNGTSKKTFRIDDMGDKYQKRTPYFVDVYFGLDNTNNRTFCEGFGTKYNWTVSW